MKDNWMWQSCSKQGSNKGVLDGRKKTSWMHVRGGKAGRRRNGIGSGSHVPGVIYLDFGRIEKGILQV